MIKLTYTSALNILLASSICLSCSEDEPSELLMGAGIFETLSDESVIEGELFLPPGEGPFPAMIIVPGSGNGSRKELESFVPILNQNGYALYIYDKRGVGNSTGSYPNETPETQTEFLGARANDVLGILDLLKTHGQIERDRVGIYGSSQGAWVNSIVYEKSADLAYIVMASGGVASTGLEGYYCELTDDPNVTIGEAISQLTNFKGAVGFDPLPIIQRMELPVLWIYGNDDRSHPVRYDVEVLEDLNKANFTVHLYPNTNHELIDLSTDEPPANLYSDLGRWLMENN